ncbi:PKD domain-containing protein, partial [bacterium]|nr:PKD domain-containing protein [bacterium]
SFSAFFTFTLTEHFDFSNNSGNSESGADGICFVLQGQSNSAGSTGEGIGYAGVSPSVAVEFDTYQNGGSKEPAGGSGDNHVAIIENGNNGTPAAHLASVNVPGTNALQDGTWSVWVDYNGTSNVMEVRYVKNSMSRPGSANVSNTIDLASRFPNGVFMGFSSATGGCRSKHVVDDVLFSNSYFPGGLNPSTGYTAATPPPAPDPHTDSIYRGTSATLTGTCSADPTVLNYTWFGSATGENPLGNGATYITPNLTAAATVYHYSAISPYGLQGGRATYTVETFTIGPATNPNPGDGAVDVLPVDSLRWDPPTTGVATGYKVFAGTDNPPTNMTNGIDIGNVRALAVTCHAATQYFWKIVPYEVNGHDCPNPPTWTFTRAFINPATPRWPADGEIEVVPVDSLRWTPPATGEPVTGYRLYVGTDPAATDFINGEDVGDVVSYFMNWSLEPKTQYYWKIIPYNALGDVCLTPPTWTFTRNSFRRGFARYLAAPLAALPNTEVQFTNACGGAQNSFLWNFGDGEFAGFKHEVTGEEKVHPTHLYPDAGLYTVSLKSWGCWLNSPDDGLIIEDLICIDEDYAALTIVDSSETNEGYGWAKTFDHDVFTTNCKMVAELPDVTCTFMFADTSVRNVDRVRVFMDDIYKTNFAGHLTQEFEVWCSLDQVSWTKAIDGVIPWENRGHFTDFTFDAVTARFVKLNLTKPHNAAAKTIQLTEFQVFGTKNEDMTLDKN